MSATGLPPWLKRRLELAGHMDPHTGATRRARARFCQRCHRVVMRGISADWGGMSVDCDPTPLSAMGEVLALLNGRPTYELRWLFDRYEIDRRDAFRIKARPAATIAGVDVLVEHVCSAPDLPGAPTMLADQAHGAAELPDDPPF